MEKEQWAEVLKIKDIRGETEEVVPIPAISTGNHGRLQEAAVSPESDSSKYR